jgi:predicted phage terminase large subunit-like protein
MATAQVDLSHLTHEQKAELRYRLELRKTYATQSADENRKLIERLKLEGDLALFARAAWPILEPGVELNWSWHYELFCEYLSLVYQRKLTRLIINLPPRTGKSIFISVIFPAWVWTKQNTHNFACASYSKPLSTEHSVKRRSLLESEWYQSHWGDKVQLARDQNEKTKFKNTMQAQMLATSVGATTLGLGGDTMILDDGMNPKQVGSDADVLTAHTWFDGTWRNRLNNLATGAFVIMEQRTGERDISGHCLEADDLLEKEGKPREWTHLAIPLECENEPARYVFPISKRVKIREVGDVLQPTRFPPAVVNSLKTRRLVFATQYQQHPSPLEGNMVMRSDFRYYGGRDPLTNEPDPEMPAKFDLILVSADCAFKDEKTSDFVAVGTFGIKGPNKYILEVVNKHLDLPATETEILRQQSKYRAQVVLVEDKANGSAIIKSIRRKVSGVVEVGPEGGKVPRMYAAAGDFQGHNVFIDRNAAWSEIVLEQVTKFPAAKYDDVADMVTQAITYLQRNTYTYGLTEYVKQEVDKMAKQKARDKKANEDQKITVDNPQMGKIDTDDKTVRCVNEECRSTFIQRTPGGPRCGACGTMQPKPSTPMPLTTNFGELRK